MRPPGRSPISTRSTLAKDFADQDHHGQGTCSVQDNLPFYPAGQLFYKPQQADEAWVEIPFQVAQREPRRLLLKVTRANDYGIYQAYLNGVKIGPPLDLYAQDVSEWEFHLLDFWPDPGDYTLRLECVGKNPLSQGHFLGIESVRLRERRPRVAGVGARTGQRLAQATRAARVTSSAAHVRRFSRMRREYFSRIRRSRPLKLCSPCAVQFPRIRSASSSSDSSSASGRCTSGGRPRRAIFHPASGPAPVRSD